MNSELKEHGYFIVGSGISGIAAAKLLTAIGAKRIILFDGNEKADKDKIREKLPENFTGEIVIGTYPESLENVDIAVLSPGVPLDSPVGEYVKENNLKMWGELELGYKTGAGELLAITGTNGKTTTTSLVGEILKEEYAETFVVGNIGLPYTEYTLEMTEKSVTVAEVSSFQLETIDDFKPKVSAILNITPDHLNRHYTMENYANAKYAVAKNQTKDDVIVLNYEDELLREKAKDFTPKVFFFSSKHELEEGIFLRGNDFIYREDGSEQVVLNVSDTSLLGVHNYENIMAAVAVCAHAGVSFEKIRDAVRKFKAVEHRIEFVKEVNGVKYYNDSKGTNPDATIKAIEAMITPTVIIAGGYDKKSEYDEMLETFGDTIKHMVTLGATAPKIEECALKHGFKNFTRVESLKDAVIECSKVAESGDAVLLSPACASWDMFKSYEERGELFKEYVKEL